MRRSSRCPPTWQLKDPKDFVYIGKPARAAPMRAKSNGTALFTQDVKLPGMLTRGAAPAALRREAEELRRRESEGGERRAGSRRLLHAESNGVGAGEGLLTAKNGRDALVAEWDEGSAFKMSSSDILAEYKKLAATPGTQRKEGDAESALKNAARTLEASYEFPYLAHAALEPMNCVVKLDSQGLRDLERRAVPDRGPGGGRPASASSPSR